MRTDRFPAVVALAILSLAGTRVEAGVTGTEEGTWEIEGVMSDACQCSVFCSCEFNDKPTMGHCDDAATLHIRKGHYGAVRLDGLRVTVVTQSPQGERVVDAVGHLNFAHIYVPKEAGDAEAGALSQIVRRAMGVFVNGAAMISEHEEVQRVSMEATAGATRHRIRIPGILDLDIEAMMGGDGKTPIVIANHPFAALGFGDPIVSRSRTYTYKHGNLDWNYGGRSASIRTFKLAGEIKTASAQPAAQKQVSPQDTHPAHH